MLPERVSAEAYQTINENSSALERLLRATVVEHQERYKLSARIIDADLSPTIIDAASGSGWGTHYLAKTITTSEVIGIEIDEAAIKEAEENFSRQNIKYIRADLLNPAELAGVMPVDWIVCLEFLEHVPEDKAPAFLDNLRNLTVDKGKLILSTPNRTLFSPFEEDQSSFSHHSKEYTPGELSQLLETNGWSVDSLFGQLFVDPNIYLKLARRLLPLRKVATRIGFPEEHKATRIPVSLLHRLGVIQARGYGLQRFDSRKEPLFMTVICSRL